MTFNSLKELPTAIKRHLPTHAQEIFKEAFNSVRQEYKDGETAYKVAWSAVKEKYKKNAQGYWVKQ